MELATIRAPSVYQRGAETSYPGSRKRAIRTPSGLFWFQVRYPWLALGVSRQQGHARWLQEQNALTIALMVDLEPEQPAGGTAGRLGAVKPL